MELRNCAGRCIAMHCDGASSTTLMLHGCTKEFIILAKVTRV